MNVRRSWFFFLVALLICVCVTALLAEGPIMENLHALQGVEDGCRWQCVGVQGGRMAAAGWEDGELVLRYFTSNGARTGEQRIQVTEEMEGGTVIRMLPIREGASCLGLLGPNAHKLYVLVAGEDGETERLLVLDCPGASCEERMARTLLSELLYEDGELAFAVLQDQTLERYRYFGEGGLESDGVVSCGGETVLSILSTRGGPLLLGGMDLFTLNGKTAEGLAEGLAVTHLTQGRGGWYYLDARTLDLSFVDAALGASYRVFRLEPAHPVSLRSVALTREERVLSLLDDGSLWLTDSEGTRELDGVLHPTTLNAALFLAKYAGISLVTAALLWLLLCGLRRGYAPMVAFRGGLFVAAALLCFTGLRFFVLSPMLHTSDLREQETAVSGALRTARAQERMDDPSLTQELCVVLEGAGGGRNVRVLRTVLGEDGRWRTADGCEGAAMESGFRPALTEEAALEGRAAALDRFAFYYALSDGTCCLSIRSEVSGSGDDALLLRTLALGFAALTVLGLLILLSVSGDIRRIARKMEQISQGGVPERLELHTGDELESMASIVNSMGASIRQQEEARERVERAYRRFVPEKVLALLGQSRIQDVDKSAFAARRMAVMTVWFSFPDTLYTDMSNSRLLFDSVNEVIERTASIVARKGGTVFHFSYNGFDVVMDEGVEAISTAVAIQQEVLGFNELRAQSGLPRVTLRIALDKGNVMLGIVGDTSQMEPTTISTSLSTVQELIDLCNRLKAGILCTEAIIAERQDYGNRYMGKCMVGSQSVRVYEVFDGDEFSVRRGKAGSMRDFSKGVYDLYGGNAAEAKHTFLQLAHNYPQDGGARYYLYLADRLEHDPSLPCVLNVDNAAGEEM